MAVSVSVIVPTYNRKDLLQQSLRSLRAQSRAPLEIIVVDDCSDDGTWETIVNDSSLTVLKSPRQGGKAAAINFALPHVTGEVVWGFDDDDVASATAVEQIARAFEKHPSASFVFGIANAANTLPNGELGPSRPGVALPDLTNGIFPALLETNFLGGASIAVRTAALREIHGFDESLIRSQDYDLALRLARTRTGVPVQGGALFVCRQHNGTRGTKEASFDAASRNAKWLEYDQRIFRGLREQLELREYSVLPGSDRVHRRELLLRRAFVMATKVLDAELLDDVADAVRTRQGVPLNSTEIQLLERTLYHQPYYTGTALIQRPALRKYVVAILDAAPEWRLALRQVAVRRTTRWLRSVANQTRIGMQRATIMLALESVRRSSRESAIRASQT